MRFGYVCSALHIPFVVSLCTASYIQTLSTSFMVNEHIQWADTREDGRKSLRFLTHND
jgi:putative flippase GtrA